MKSNRLAIEKALDEIIKNEVDRTHYKVERDSGRSKVVYKYNKHSKIWYFPYSETISIESVRRRIFGRHNAPNVVK
jgi:hypothetical protein